MLDYNLVMSKLQEVSEVASELILKKFLKLKSDGIFYKQDQTEIVSQVDITVEKIVINFLSNSFPSAQFISEEMNAIPSIESNMDELLFIIDPIDGTSNYIYGIEYFVLSVGIMSFGRFIGGIVIAPYLKEVFCAVENCFALYKVKNKSISFKEVLRNRNFHQNKYLIGTTYPCINLIYDKLSKKVSVRIFGSVALTACYSLIGKLDGFISNKAKIWDIAGAIGIAAVLGVKFFMKYNEYDETYSLILHRDEKELEKLKLLLGF